jgi:hypothetical protein
MNLPNVLMIGKDPLSGEWTHHPSPPLAWAVPSALDSCWPRSSSCQFEASTVETHDRLGEVLKSMPVALRHGAKDSFFLKERIPAGPLEVRVLENSPG